MKEAIFSRRVLKLKRKKGKSSESKNNSNERDFSNKNKFLRKERCQEIEKTKQIKLLGLSQIYRIELAIAQKAMMSLEWTRWTQKTSKPLKRET